MRAAVAVLFACWRMLIIDIDRLLESCVISKTESVAIICALLTYLTCRLIRRTVYLSYRCYIARRDFYGIGR
jgi:hypothetical protein